MLEPQSKEAEKLPLIERPLSGSIVLVAVPVGLVVVFLVGYLFWKFPLLTVVTEWTIEHAFISQAVAVALVILLSIRFRNLFR